MELTGADDLPLPLKNMLRRDEYQGFERDEDGNLTKIRVTALIDSPYKQELEAEHGGATTISMHDAAAPILGNAFHEYMDGATEGLSDWESEVELTSVWIGDNAIPVKITGHVDLIEYRPDDTACIWDYKVTSDYNATRPDPKWEQQLNVYAELVLPPCRVDEVKIVAVLRDWSAGKGKWRKGYPESRVVVIPLRLWPVEERRAFIFSRLEAWNAVMPCSLEERWHKPEMYRLKEHGKSRGRMFRTFDDAERESRALSAEGKRVSIERLPESFTRCERFCAVKEWCEYYR